MTKAGNEIVAGAEVATEAQLLRDVAVIRRAMQELSEGKGQDAEKFFGGLQAELLAMKATSRKPFTR